MIFSWFLYKVHRILQHILSGIHKSEIGLILDTINLKLSKMIKQSRKVFRIQAHFIILGLQRKRQIPLVFAHT